MQRTSVMTRPFVVLAIMAAIVPTATAQWIPVPDPGEFEGIELFLPSQDDLFCGTTTGRVFGSLDHGDTWIEIAGGLEDPYAPVQALVLVGDYLVMSRAFFDEYNYRTRREGDTWTPWEPLGYQDDAIHSFAVIGETLFAVLTGGEVHRSDDYGTTWTAVTAPSVAPIWWIFAEGGRLFASNHQINAGQIYRSDDLGENWVEVGDGLGSSYVCSQQRYQDRLLLCVYHMGGVGSFWSSTDHGDSWTRVTTLPTSYNINGMAVAADGRLAIGASSGYPDHASIWLSADLVAWEDYTGDLPQASWPFNSLVAHDGWFFKTGGTVTPYRAPQPEVSGAEDRPPSPIGVNLRVHPNPFNPQTTVAFALARDERTEVGVFDVSGRLVAELLSRRLAAGAHSVTWNGRDASGRSLPSGSYLVRVRTETAVEVAKITLAQ